MVPKGTPPEVIDNLAKQVPMMFAHDRVAKRMKAGGSPMKIMNREEVQKMWADREASERTVEGTCKSHTDNHNL